MDKVKELSAKAKQIINSWEKRESIKGESIIMLLKRSNLPILDVIVDFQERYGGISYRIKGVLDSGFVLDLFYNVKHQFVIPYVDKYDGKYLFKCIHYYTYRTGDDFICEDGKIYRSADGKIRVIADSIEEFLESEAVKCNMLSIQKFWFAKSFYESYLSNWLMDTELGLLEVEESSGNCSRWWKGADNKIFINCHYNNGEFQSGTAFTANSDTLKKLKSQGFSMCTVFPLGYTSYDFEKKYSVIDNPNELYYFNEKLYRTCNSNHIKVEPVNEPSDVYLYMSGKKEINICQPVNEFLNKFSKFDLNKDVFNSDLVKYAIDNESENILRIIDYLTEVDNKNQNSWHIRTIAENNVYMLLAGEYFRLLIEFMELEHIGIHPLYCYNIEIPDVVEEVNIELLFTKLDNLEKYSYSKSFVSACLKYMKLAQEGNKIAAKYYKVFEPVLVLYAAGGYFSKEHGFLSVCGYTFSMNSWVTQAGKAPINIYEEMPKAWAARNFNYASDRIKRIKLSKDGQLPKLPQTPTSLGINRLKLFLNSFMSSKGKDYSEVLHLASKLEGTHLKNITDFYPNLKEVEDTLIGDICERYLEWAVLMDTGNKEAIKNPCIYEPFIELYIEGDNLVKLYNNTLTLIKTMKTKPMVSYYEFIKSQY